MREFHLAIGIIGVLALISGAMLLPWSSLYLAAWVVIIVGMSVGVPTGFAYHIVLYKQLKMMGEVPRGWYWRPTTYNSRLDSRGRARVLPWFYVGGAGFILVAIGIALIVTAMIAGLFG
jgi:hypothetical protein